MPTPTYSTIKSQIIDLLKQNPNGITGVDIGKNVGLTGGAISKYLGMMYAEGIVEYREVGMAKLWYLSEKIQLSKAEMQKRIKKFIFSQDFEELANYIKLKDGELIDPMGTRSIITSVGTLAHLQETAEQIVGKEKTAQIFYEAGKKLGKEFAEKARQEMDLDGKSSIEIYIHFASIRGWGKTEHLEVTDDKILLRLTKIAWGSVMPKTDHPVDHFRVGSIVGMAEQVLGGKWKGTETKCIAKGDPYCEILVTKAS
jgi:predicted hydrocarbon binding protein